MNYRILLINKKFIFFLSFVIILTILLFASSSLISIVVIRGNSMNPTLDSGDRVIVLKNQNSLENIQYKDIVIFKAPNDSNQQFVKRVIAVEKQEYILKEGVLKIDGVNHCEEYIDCLDYPLENYSQFSGVVPLNKVYLLGDNRSESNDSRQFGYICST